MNIVNTLTLRHIKTHKKRSVLTIMAIIVSVAMVTAVFTSAISFINYFKNVSEAIDGTWHSYINTDNYIENIPRLNQDDIKKYGVGLSYGNADINGDNDYSEMVINACDKNYLDLKNVVISEGNMPCDSDEILIHKGFAERNSLDWKIGDTVTLKTALNEEITEKDYKIVGFTNSNVAETDFVSGFVYATEDLIKQSGEVCVYVEFSTLNKNVYDNTEKLAHELNKNDSELNYGCNSEYLTYSGYPSSDNGTFGVLIGFCSILLAIIAIVSIFMIYDSFSVSYQERARYIGMLASVGATKRQKRTSIYFEGFILGLIGIPLGIISGIGGIAVTFKAISEIWSSTGIKYDGALETKVNWIVIAGTIIASAVTIFISSYIPAVKASKTTAIDAIRQSNTVKVKKAKKLKTSKLTPKLFGYEGTMAVKNFKRNSRRSRTIVLSLFMSVVVFLAATNFSAMFKDVMEFEFTQSADLIVSVPCSDAKVIDDAISKNNNIKRHFSICYLTCKADEKYLTDEYKDTYNEIMVAFVDNETIDSYLSQLGEDEAKFHNPDKPTGILHNVVRANENGSKTTVSPFVDVEGDDVTCSIITYNSETREYENSGDISINVGVQTKKDWNNKDFYYQNISMPLLMLSVDYAPQLLPNKDQGYYVNITCDDVSLVKEQMESVLEDNGIEGNCSDLNSQMQQMNNLLTIVDVFVFGFIALITLISIMNIINTISNSMNERRREFAMIRSVGMTPKSFRRMIYYESIRYGVKSLLWSLPISVLIHYAMYKALAQAYDFGFVLHIYLYIISVLAVFVIIAISLLYSITKIKDDNIIETLKMDIN